jgi:hypothetical protein
VTPLHRAILGLVPVALVTVVAGCGGDEPLATHDHTPTTFSVLINDLAVTAPYTIPSGETVRVRLKLFNAAQDDLDDVEAEHFAGLTFNPVSRATAVRLADHHYQFDVTGGVPGSGAMTIGFGHDEAAAEHTLGPANITVTP